MKTYWLPADDNGKDLLLTNISGKLPKYKPVFNLDQEDIDSTTADAIFFHFSLVTQGQAAAYSQQWTAYKNAARSGSDPALGDVPVAPVLGTVPTPVAPGIFKRLTALVAHIKTHKNYTDAIGQDLWIVGSDIVVDPTTLKPVITAVLDAAGVIIGWVKQGMDGLEIWVDRNDGKGFVFLVLDTVPDYTDTQTVPAGQSALWKYKAIYHQGDARVGLWSDVVSIAVGA
jgi:hypothetical protein